MSILKLCTLLMPCLIYANSSISATPTMDWRINSPEPLNQITFGITINEAAPIDEFYFANQFSFTGGGGGGYTGIQPTKNTSHGKRQFLVLFSSFRKDTTVNHLNCKSGADGEKAGATCRLYIPGELGDSFLFHVKKEGQLMTGAVLNKSTGREDIIGQWKIGMSSGSLAISHSSWIENYKMNDPNFKLTCDNKGWPYYEVKFLPPTGNYGKIQGTISTLSRGSDACPGAITWSHDKTGTLVKGGFR